MSSREPETAVSSKVNQPKQSQDRGERVRIPTTSCKAAGNSQDVMRCLKIEDKWVRLILEGKKTLEIRRTRTNYRGPLAIGSTKTKKVEGYAHLNWCVELKVGSLKQLSSLHLANNFLDAYANGRKTLFAYELKNVRTEPKPFPYSFSTGSWCSAPVDDTHYHLLLLPIESELGSQKVV